MAKVSFTKLGLVKNQEIKSFEYNGQVIEVKQYLPINDKLNMIAAIVEKAHDSQKEFSNPVKVEVFLCIEIIKNYTNITFTEKQLEAPEKLYDLLIGNGFMGAILENLPKNEYQILYEDLMNIINSIYTYQNSVMGILDSVSQDYSNLDLDATKIQQKLSDPNNLELLRQIFPITGLN